MSDFAHFIWMLFGIIKLSMKTVPWSIETYWRCAPVLKTNVMC